MPRPFPVDNFIDMSKSIDPQRVADLYRRIAKIPTLGDRLADRALLVLADRLECEAKILGEQPETSGRSRNIDRRR